MRETVGKNRGASSLQARQGRDKDESRREGLVPPSANEESGPIILLII